MAKADTNVANVEGAGGALAGVIAWPGRLKEYVTDLKAEMQRVTWPGWKQVRATTAVVIAAVFGFAAYFMVVDLLLGRAIDRVFSTFTR